MRNLDDDRRDAGFTLLEAIVAFMVMSMVLGSATLSVSYSARLQRQGDARRLAVTCAQRLVAERFDRRRGLPAAENGVNQDNCRWRIARQIAKASYTESGRNLIAFRLEVLNPQGRVVEAFDAYYVEDLP